MKGAGGKVAPSICAGPRGVNQQGKAQGEIGKIGRNSESLQEAAGADLVGE